MGIISGAIQTGLGMATAKWQDKRQLEQQKKLQAEQIKGQKEMGEFNQGLALDTWEKTNYDAQRKQMEKAGLNVGMMYGGTGSGGTTQGGSAGQVTGGTASGGTGEIGMAIQLGLQQEMQKAQIELAKSQSEKNAAETEKISGADTTKTTTETASITQGINNAKIQAELMEWDKKLKEIEANVSGATAEERIKQIGMANDQLEGQVKSATAQGEIDQATVAEKIKQIKQASLEQALRIGMQKMDIVKTGQETEEIKQKIKKTAQDMLIDIEQMRVEWQKIGLSQGEQRIKQQEYMLKKIQTEFSTATPEKIKQWIEVIQDIANIGATVTGGAKDIYGKGGAGK